VSRRYALLYVTLGFLGAGAAASIVDAALGRRVWLVGMIVAGAPLVWRTLAGVLRGRFATDVVASLSIIGAVALGQPLAGLVIVLMQSGGEALERYAEGRASLAVRELEAAAPRIAHVVRDDGVVDTPASEVAVHDTLLVRPGDLIPCDGVVVAGESELDTSSLTGEAQPRPAAPGVNVMSGMLNGFGSFQMRVSALAARSQYARIVALVRDAQTSKAPIQRLADRYAVWFTPITLAVCAIAAGTSGDWMRALAVLVVATPCPLILATPVAIIGGINRAAKRFIIIRHGAALERLSAVDAAVFDKTGTITVGKPRLHAVRVAAGFSRAQVLRAAAAVEDHSSHSLARVVVEAANAEGISADAAFEIVESPGQGISGVVDGHEVRVGARAFVVPAFDDDPAMVAALEQAQPTLRAYVVIDRKLAAVLEYADEVRPELPHLLAALSNAGVRRVALLSGDHAPVARALASRVGIHESHGDLLPIDKARFIERLQAEGYVVSMVGDGINDAPALSTADVGIALAAHGGGVTAEAADVIILVDSLARVGDALEIGRRTMRIARQSIWVGLGLSGVAMLVAAFGGTSPLVGALVQEAIDVAVILNALRTAAAPRVEHAAAPSPTSPREMIDVQRISTLRA